MTDMLPKRLLNARVRHIVSALLFLAASVLIANDGVAEVTLPIGSEIEYRDGEESATATTPDGKKVRVELSSYDQWWLAKSEAEQAAWLDFWLSQVESAAKAMDPSYTFVMFMKSVQKNQLNATDFGLTYEGISGRDPEPPPYAVEIAKIRCANYRKGINFDEGRDRVGQSLSQASKVAAARDLMLGTSNSKPTLIGMILMATNVTRGVDAQCASEASRAHSKGSRFD